MTASCPTAQLQCCVAQAPDRPAQAPPPQTVASAAPDFAPLHVDLGGAAPGTSPIGIASSRPPALVVPPLLYLRHAAFLV